MKKALITGITGQDGIHLTKFLKAKNYQIFGLIRGQKENQYDNFRTVFPEVELLTGDLADFSSLINVLKQTEPDEVYNLAAQSFVGSSWRLAFATTNVDALGPLNFLEVIKRVNPNIRFYQAATSEMFGNNSTNGVQTEETAFMPASPYGVAKLYGYHITKNFRDSYGMFACSGVLFNHESPLRGIEFVTRKVTDGVAQIKAGKQDKILLGNLNAERDWGHAKDFVKAQWLMLQQDKPDDFIIATGVKHTISDLCKVAFETAGISDWQKHVGSHPDYVRPHDLVSLHASSSKAKFALDWEPTISFKEMIEEMTLCDLKRHGL
jgi:GDPmannose 4,6-dehydratase